MILAMEKRKLCNEGSFKFSRRGGLVMQPEGDVVRLVCEEGTSLPSRN